MHHQRYDVYVVHDAGVVALPLPAGVLAVAIRHVGRMPLQDISNRKRSKWQQYLLYASLHHSIPHMHCSPTL